MLVCSNSGKNFLSTTHDNNKYSLFFYKIEDIYIEHIILAVCETVPGPLRSVKIKVPEALRKLLFWKTGAIRVPSFTDC